MTLAAERFLAVNPLVPAPYRALAQAAEATGSLTNAIAANRTLLRLDPPNPSEVHFRLAKALNQAGDPGARMEVLMALEEAPRNREALRLLKTLGPGFGSGTGTTNRAEKSP